MKTLLATVVVVLVCLVPDASPAVPQMMNYQGRLTNDGGQPLDTIVSFSFSLYRDSSDVVPLWSDTIDPVDVNSGLFNVILGKEKPIQDSVFDSSNVWLGIRVGNESLEIYPKTEIVSVGYAYRVASIDGANGGAISGNATVSGLVDVGSFKMSASAQDGYVLTSDAGGLSSWQDPGSISSVPFPFQSQYNVNIFHLYQQVNSSVTLYTVPAGKTLYITGVNVGSATTGTTGYFLRNGATVLFYQHSSAQLPFNWTSGGGAPIIFQSGETLGVQVVAGNFHEVNLMGYLF